MLLPLLPNPVQSYSAAFLGMDNAAYCAWITNPVNWGGGIELAILASHYSREIAAWNIETGQCHVFGEERGVIISNDNLVEEIP